MSKRTILSISMACMLAGLLFFAGCEKVKAETEKEKAETEKDTVENSPMVAYLTGKWQMAMVRHFRRDNRKHH